MSALFRSYIFQLTLESLMDLNQQILVGRFWQHVFTSPDDTANMIKNPSKENTVAFAAVPYGGVGGVYVYPPKPFVDLTWQNAGKIVAEFAAALQEQGIKRGDRVAILSWNCPEWVWTDLAIQTLGAVAVPIYPNSAAEAVNYIVKDCDAKLLLGDTHEQTDKVAPESGVPTLCFCDVAQRSAIYRACVLGEKRDDQELGSPLPVSEAAQHVLNSVSWQVLDSRYAADIIPVVQKIRESEALRDAGMPAAADGPKGNILFYEVAPKGSVPQGIGSADFCTLIYTSGSTGVPKGVALTNANISASCQGVHDHGFDFNESDRYLSYLPLAHVYERVNGQFICIWYKVPVAFCKVDEMPKVLPLVKPTILLGVPQVWRKIKEKVEGDIARTKGFAKTMARWAFEDRNGMRNWLARKIVFTKIRKGLGGGLRIMGSGGAAISPEVLSFYRKIGLNIIQGYGLTETCGAVVANTPDANEIGAVGRCIPGIELKFVPVAGQEAKPNEGIIYLRGDPVFAGYWNLPEENAKSFADGWFNTGDIGRLDDKGNLYITGRAKLLFKTEGGKYVAPEKVEKAFDGHSIIQCLVPVGDARPFVSAIIFVNQAVGRELITKAGVTIPSDNAQSFIAGHDLVKTAIKEAIAEGNQRLEHWETVKKYEIIAEEASVANGLLTATLKVRPTEVMKRYAERIELIYKK